MSLFRKDCPECGTKNTTKNGHIKTGRGKVQRYICANGDTFYDFKDYAPPTKRQRKRWAL